MTRRDILVLDARPLPLLTWTAVFSTALVKGRRKTEQLTGHSLAKAGAFDQRRDYRGESIVRGLSGT